MGIASSLFAKPLSKALTKSVAKQADVVVPKIVAEVAEPITAGVSLPTKSLVNRKARGTASKPAIKEEPVAAPQEDVDTGINTDPLFKEEEAILTPVVDDVFMPPKVDRIEDFGVEPELIADSGTDAFKALDLSADKKEAWRKENKASQRSRLLPEIEEAAQKLFDGTLKPEEFRKLSVEKQPIVPLDKVPDMPSFKDIAGALTEAQVNKGIVGLNMKIPKGERVSSRLDIPAYNDYNTWVVSLHEGSTKSGAPIGYAKTAVLQNVEFVSDPKVALDIARRKPLGSGGRMGKATIARIFGDYVPHNPENVKAYAEKIFNDPEWTQVGMNPYRASYFYDKTDNMPVVSADEIVQIGPLVMAKNVKKTKPDDALFKVNKKDDASPTFAKGGVVKNEMDKLFAEGGVMQEGGTIDPVSGNDVPPGAMAEEVRDDIPAQLSEGEFVFPADVVRFYGLEKLMAMRDKAKSGLKRMNDIGQMGNADEVDNAEALFGDEDDMDDDTFSSEIDSIMNDGDEQEYAIGGDVRKYAPGGYVGGAENEQLYRDAPIKGFEMVLMTNDAGQSIYIPFINGVAQLNVPAGYKVKTANEAVTTPVVPETGATTGGGDGGTGGDSGGGGGGGNTTIGMNASISPEGIVSNTPVSTTVAGIIGSIVSTVVGLSPVQGFTFGKNAAEAVNAANATTVAASNAAIADTMSLNVNNISQAAITAEESAAGKSGVTGGAAASAASTAAAAAAAAGMSDAAIGAASQAAADATVSGLSAAQAAEQGNNAAVSVTIGENNAAAAASTSASTAANTSGPVGNEGTATGNDAGVGDAPPGGGEAPSVGDTAPSSDAAPSGGDGAAGTGASSSGDGTGSGGDGPGSTLAKGGFVFKRKPKKTVVKNTGLASRK